MKKTLMLTACIAAGLTLAACGDRDEAAPAAADAATDASATADMGTGAASPAANAGATSGAPAAPADSGAMASSGAMSSSTTAPAATDPNQQVPGGVVNSSDPVPPTPGDYSSTNPRPN